MSVLDEVLAPTRPTRPTSRQGRSWRMPPARALRDPDLHGRPPGPGEVRRPQRGRRPRHPQRRRPRERRRDPLARHLLQAARHAEWFVMHHTNCGMEFFTSELMGDLLESSLETAALGDEGFYDVGEGPGSPEGKNIDWLTISDQRAERRRRRREDPQPPARAGHHPDLRLRLPRRDAASSSRFPRRPRPARAADTADSAA